MQQQYGLIRISTPCDRCAHMFTAVNMCEPVRRDDGGMSSMLIGGVYWTEKLCPRCRGTYEAIQATTPRVRQ